jgi:large subunit ribosomal protein L40e
MMQIQIKYSNSFITIEVESTDSILDVKNRIEKKFSYKAIDQKLIYSGRELNNNKCVKDYNIEKASTILLVLINKDDITLNLFIENELEKEKKQKDIKFSKTKKIIELKEFLNYDKKYFLVIKNQVMTSNFDDKELKELDIQNNENIYLKIKKG